MYIDSVNVIRGEGRGQASNLVMKGRLKSVRVGVESNVSVVSPNDYVCI